MNATIQQDLQSLPLIAHIVYRFDYGGLENGVVNLINATQDRVARHSVIALTEATDFQQRLNSPEIRVDELKKRPGKDPASYLSLYRLLRKLRPDVLHTRNLGTLDCAVVGRLAGVPVRIHGEHGWDTYDPFGTNKKYQRLRRLVNPSVNRFVTVSAQLQRWLIDTVGIDEAKVSRICNGVDTARFVPLQHGEKNALRERFPEGSVIVGSVLRFQDIKDPMNLVNAFILARSQLKASGGHLCLVMLGDGPIRETAQQAIDAANLGEFAWLPGARDDIPELMRCFDLFALGSLREGISNTVLEAMASGLPTVATETGGNPELVRPGVNGSLVPPADHGELAAALVSYAYAAEKRQRQGEAARRLALDEYSIGSMITNYEKLYSEMSSG